MIGILIAVGAVLVIALLVSSVVLVRKMGGLSIGRVFAEHPMQIGVPLEVGIPAIEGTLVVGLRMAYTYRRGETNTMPVAEIDVEAGSIERTLVDGTFSRTGAEFDLTKRWSGADAWRRSTRRVVEVPAPDHSCTLRVLVRSTLADQVDEVALVLAEKS